MYLINGAYCIRLGWGTIVIVVVTIEVWFSIFNFQFSICDMIILMSDYMVWWLFDYISYNNIYFLMVLYGEHNHIQHLAYNIEEIWWIYIKCLFIMYSIVFYYFTWSRASLFFDWRSSRWCFCWIFPANLLCSRLELELPAAKSVDRKDWGQEGGLTTVRRRREEGGEQLETDKIQTQIQTEIATANN